MPKFVGTLTKEHEMKRTIVLSLLVAMAIVTSACSLVGATAPPAAATLPAAAPPDIQPVIPAPVLPPPPAATTAPSPTPVPTPGPAMFTVTNTAGLNCRFGPGTAYDPPLTGITQGTTVPIVGRTDMLDLSTWWLVSANGQTCWVSALYGYASGNLAVVPSVPAPPLPPYGFHMGMVWVDVFNETGANICRLDFIEDGEIVFTPPTWGHRQFMDGTDQEVLVPRGHYDRVKAYSCKPTLVGKVSDVFIGRHNNSLTITP